MVDIMGHIAMGLLWAVPAWYLWSERVALLFVGLVAVTALFPDVDLWLSALFPSLVHHHGITHTVLFVVLSSALVGVIVAATLTGRIDHRLDGDRFSRSSFFVFVFSATLLGGLSHLFADMLSAPDVAQPIEPFWPFFDKAWTIDVIWYNSPWWNVGLLTAAVLLHVTVASLSDPVDHSYRITGA